MICTAQEGEWTKESNNSSEMGTVCPLDTSPGLGSLSNLQSPRLFSPPVLREQEKCLGKPTVSFHIEERKQQRQQTPMCSHHFLGGWCPFPPTGTESGSFITGKRYMIQESILAPILDLGRPVLSTLRIPISISKDFKLPHPQEYGQRKRSSIKEPILRKAHDTLQLYPEIRLKQKYIQT